MSAANVMNAIDRSRYDVFPVKIERDGRWFLQRGGDESPDEIALRPGGDGALVGAADLPRIDVLFPVLHGPFGEDGTVQGAAETAGVPYVGAGVLGSALCMDKDMTKRLLTAAGIPVARSLTFAHGETLPFETVAARLGKPVFVKPARQGSSFGVGKAADPESFQAAIAEAFRHDDKLLVEEFVAGREIECAVLERPDGALLVSDPGEIITSATHAFYTYQAKYFDAAGAIVKTPAEVSAHVAFESRRLAEKAFRTLDCAGMARVDFFLRPDSSLLLNEVNTLPGFTNSSMYAKALAAGGMPYERTVDTLIETALARHASRSRSGN